MGDSEPEQVLLEKNWTSLLVTSQDKLMSHWFLKSRVAVLLEAIADMVPTYTEKDLVVCHRQNSSGAWKCELWTKRDFEKRELVFAPMSSQLKETHLSFSHNCVIGVPQHGRGAPLEPCALALDGRCRASLASQNLVDTQEHKGALFWIVQRVPPEEPANMSLDMVGWRHKVTLFPPLPKVIKHEVDWETADLPVVPIMVNLKAIKAHRSESVV